MVGKLIIKEDGSAMEELPIFTKPRQKFKKTRTGKVYLCDICKMKFHHPARLDTHYKNHHQPPNEDAIGTNKEPISSEPSAEEKGDEETLPNNVKRERNIKCEQCDSMFTCKQNYEVHVKAVHERERKYKCKLCPR